MTPFLSWQSFNLVNQQRREVVDLLFCQHSSSAGWNGSSNDIYLEREKAVNLSSSISSDMKSGTTHEPVFPHTLILKLLTSCLTYLFVWWLASLTSSLSRDLLSDDEGEPFPPPANILQPSHMALLRPPTTLGEPFPLNVLKKRQLSQGTQRGRWGGTKHKKPGFLQGHISTLTSLLFFQRNNVDTS